MTSKKELEREATIYVVCQQTFGISGNYYIHKLVDDESKDTYSVTLHDNNKGMFCNCPGFVIQKYAKIDHKHIQMVLAYKAAGEPSSVSYRLGKGNKVIHVMTVD